MNAVVSPSPVAVLTVFLLLPVLLESYHIYYVKSHGSTNTSCPADALAYNTCHTLSYYTSQTDTYFVSNTTFIFMEGNHFLDRKVSIVYANNLTLKGQGQWVEGNTNNVMQSTVIITCNGKVGGFKFSISTQTAIVGITFTNCTGTKNSLLHFLNVYYLSVIMVSIQNNTGLGMSIDTSNILLIHTCSFSRNGQDPTETYNGNLKIVAFQNDVHYMIKNTNFTTGIGSKGSLSISIYKSSFVHLQLQDITVEEGMSLNGYGGNIFIAIFSSYINTVHLTRVITLKGKSLHASSQHSTGGGLFLALSQLTCLPTTQLSITDSIMDSNFAGMGGGAYLFLNQVNNCTILFENVIFSNNGYTYGTGNSSLMCTGGGGMMINTFKSIQENKFIFVNVSFSHNQAVDGGGLFNVVACRENLNIINTTFDENSGFVGAGLLFYPKSDSDKCPPQVQLTNVIFRKNTRLSTNTMEIYLHKPFSYKGKLLLVFAAMVFVAKVEYTVNITDIVVRDNFNLSGMVIRGCNVIFNGKNNAFINNSSPYIGGGLVILAKNYFQVNEGSHVSFINNSAGLYGGAIYVKKINLDVFDVSFINGLFSDYRKCTFVTNEKFNFKLNQTRYPLVSFEQNKAMAGYDIYGGIYRHCSTIPIRFQTVKSTIEDELSCPLTKYWSLSTERSISSSPFAVCPCIKGSINCSVRTLYREIYPGQPFTVSLVTVGTCQGVSPGAIVVTPFGSNLNTTTKNQKTSTQCKQFKYFASQNSSINTNATVVINAARNIRLSNAEMIVIISFLPCPTGFQLSSNTGQCVCNDFIKQIIPDNDIKCNITDFKSPFTRSGNNWIAYFKDYNCTVAHTNCPFDYCNPSLVSFNITSPNPQCAFNRAGTLCGQCKSGLSLVLGSNKCTDCTNSYLALLLPFAVAGIVLIALLITVNLTVSSGRINGLLFYANIVKLNETAFFPNGGVPVLRQFISWLNLDLGIETCFYNGLDGYWKTWLQFAFPLYLWLLALVVIISCHYSLRLSRVCGRNAVPVLATLFLMSYTKLLRNITNVFMFTTLSCNNNRWFIWSVDATLDYSSNPRLPLLIFSSILLFIGIVYTLLVFSSQWLQRYSYICCHKASRDPVFRLKPLIDAYCGPYKDSCRFWTGLLLIVRLVLTGLFSYTSSMNYQVNNIIVLGIVLLLASLAWIVGGMYKTRELNTIEILSYLNIGFITLSSIMTNGQYSQVIISGISTGVALFVLILLTLSPLFESKIKLYREKRKHVDECEMPLLGNDASSSSECSHPGSPAVILMRRESLIFEFIPEDFKSIN